MHKTGKMFINACDFKEMYVILLENQDKNTDLNE